MAEVLEATKFYHKQKINIMTLSETIIKTHEELTSGLINKEDYNLSINDIDTVIADSKKHSYDYFIQLNHISAFVKLLIESAQKYGEAKWNEAIEAAREAQCSDKNTPPKFIP